jgi:Kelch motif protein
VPDTAVEIFDLNAWSTGTPMPTARYDLGVATLGGVIYAVGGFDAGPLNTVEGYVP